MQLISPVQLSMFVSRFILSCPQRCKVFRMIGNTGVYDTNPVIQPRYVGIETNQLPCRMTQPQYLQIVGTDIINASVRTDQLRVSLPFNADVLNNDRIFLIGDDNTYEVSSVEGKDTAWSISQTAVCRKLKVSI